MYDPNRSLSDCLALSGYGHRRCENTVNTGKRVVFKLDTGEEVGRFTALEAEEFLKTSTK